VGDSDLELMRWGGAGGGGRTDSVIGIDEKKKTMATHPAGGNFLTCAHGPYVLPNL
jgi:hypothetical protein